MAKHKLDGLINQLNPLLWNDMLAQPSLEYPSIVERGLNPRFFMVISRRFQRHSPRTRWLAAGYLTATVNSPETPLLPKGEKKA